MAFFSLLRSSIFPSNPAVKRIRLRRPAYLVR
ncbi:DUF1010 domain-containing protein [Ottowia oryzae]